MSLDQQIFQSTRHDPSMATAQPSTPGTEHQQLTFGAPSQVDGAYQNVAVTGQQGPGPTRSEVIEVAADQGFASRHYEQVHQSYEQHAQSVLSQEQIPPGYRRYVRRYFERIRPR